MAVSTKLITSKIKSVKNIKKITRAMELVSVSKMQKAVERTLSGRTYAQMAIELLGHLCSGQSLAHPLMQEGKGLDTLVVAVTSNKGLCGAYNARVRKTLSEIKAKRDERDTKGSMRVVAVGKYAQRIARSLELDLVASFVDLPENVTTEDIRGIMHLVMEEFNRGTLKNVVLVHAEYESVISYSLSVRQLLPLTLETAKGVLLEEGGTEHIEYEQEGAFSQYVFEPSEEDLLSAVIPRLVEVLIYHALLEARASEHSARMFAMKSATENADALVDDLTLAYNQARQASITQEISEIASGAEALAG